MTDNKEAKYKKITLLEHVKKRPGMYLGSVEKQTFNTWTFYNNKFIKKQVCYTQGLLKIYEEIISNAVDHFERKENVTFLNVDINREKNIIEIINDGNCIPIIIDKETNLFYPSLIFGEFLTSSNYNEDDEKTWIGTYGIGAKLTNAYSKIFIVETYCHKNKILFRQKWKNNMIDVGTPEIIKNVENKFDYTKITFKPDLERFNTESLDDDIMSMFIKRLYDVAGLNNKLNVIFNKKNITCHSFKAYISLYTDENIIIDEDNSLWKFGLIIKRNINEQISFVNNTYTPSGGTHVDFYYNSLLKVLKPFIIKKTKKIPKSQDIKSHCMLFLKCQVINPEFNSQAKDKLISSIKKENEIIFSNKTIKKILDSDLINYILDDIEHKINLKLKKLNGKKTIKLNSIPKLNDAINAGTKKSKQCTLILTEGDSAKTLAISGLSVLKDRENYGVFPLKGKLLNVREATKSQLLNNEEINNLIKILGLTYNKKYTDLNSLRYGRLMLMTDQDLDGTHIKGLIINFIHYNWPELLKLNYLYEFITPIVKVVLCNKEVLSFYNLNDYYNWNKKNNIKIIKTKYYKGLGTSTTEEAKEYFRDIEKHSIKFNYIDSDGKEIIKAFSKKYISERKAWVLEVDKDGLSSDDILHNRDDLKNNNSITIDNFINKGLVHFSNADNIRSIPNVIDGLKPGPRKILYVALTYLNDNKEIKVEQLAGLVSSKSQYHHGETSLKLSTINFAHKHVGSNNINYLEPLGQFGTRLMGGKDSASPRYIYTKVAEITRAIFKKEDDKILTYNIEENQKIEPKYYVPIIPTVLVNGSRGIGTGWATNIPSYNPLDIIDEIIYMLENNSKSKKTFIPWYKYFKGEIIKTNTKGCYYSIGNIYIDKINNRVIITELPIGIWTQSYKTFLMDNDLEVLDYGTNIDVYLIVTLSTELFKKLNTKKNGFFTFFKLITIIRSNNIVAFNKDYKLKEYKSPNEVIEEHFEVRLKYYKLRKEYIYNKKKQDVLIINNQTRFIKEKCNGLIPIENETDEKIINLLISKKYDFDPRNNEKSFDYLINMPLRSLTKNKIDELEKKNKQEIKEMKEILETDEKTMWKKDLDNFIKLYNIPEKVSTIKFDLSSYKKLEYFNNDKEISINNFEISPKLNYFNNSQEEINIEEFF